MCALSPTNQSENANPSFNRHAGDKSNCGALPCPDGYALTKGTCGDSLEIFVYVAEDKISTVTFLAHGCAYTHACASALTSIVAGRDLNEAFDLEEKHVEIALNGLPREHRHCAKLAVLTLRAAITNYYSKRRAAWKSIY